MKKTLVVLLCLLTGCKELEKQTREEPEPCPLYALMPQHQISVSNLPKGFHYEIIVNNQILWNSCSQRSDLSIISATTNPGGEKIYLNFQIYENIFQENTPATVKIYKTDAQCDIIPETEVIRTGHPYFQHHSYSTAPHCGDGSITSSSLYIDYDADPTAAYPNNFCSTQ